LGLTTYDRRQSLLEQLRKQPGLRVRELAEILGISEGTVRNDLNALEMDGRVTRVHGGAILKEQWVFDHLSFATRHQEHSAEKMLIARAASELISDRDSILLDASSSTFYLAQVIQNRNRLRVITNGLDVARLLAQNPSNTVILLGGIVNQDGSSVISLLSRQIIQELHIQKAFVSSSGFSLERGLTEVHLDEAQLKHLAIGIAQEVIALIDSSKIGYDDLTTFARVEQISRLITDAGISPLWVQLIERAGISLTICQAT
jgi:DeoR/GlpR family transcriptional regulator of sugar metabolism